jgi:hypothetical protein
LIGKKFAVLRPTRYKRRRWIQWCGKTHGQAGGAHSHEENDEAHEELLAWDRPELIRRLP